MSKFDLNSFLDRDKHQEIIDRGWDLKFVESKINNEPREFYLQLKDLSSTNRKFIDVSWKKDFKKGVLVSFFGEFLGIESFYCKTNLDDAIAMIMEAIGNERQSEM